jgi:competence protein ComEA
MCLLFRRNAVLVQSEIFQENEYVKKWIVAVIGFVALMSTAFADVDANKADQVALDGLRGLGPAKSKALSKSVPKWPVQGWPDFQKRVKGIGDVTSTRLSEAGLTINGQAKPVQIKLLTHRKNHLKRGKPEGGSEGKA